jgi:tetratricopeptide (TPR) repeat protein
VELDPLNPAAHYRLGDYLQQQGQKAVALQSYQEAARLQPQMVDAARRIAGLAEELGQAAVAAAARQRIIELAPDDRPSYLRLAEIQENQLQQRANAQQTYHAFLRKFPHAPEANQVRARLGLKAATVAKPEAKKPAAAKRPAEKPAATPAPATTPPPAPPPPPPKPLDAAAAYKEALKLLHQGDFERARPDLEAVVRASPSHAQAHLALAQVYSMRAETKEKARAHYIRFLQLRPDDPKSPEVRRWLEATR